ncbi:glucose-6-phosphate dehydrogenase assembly protein OpcA [Georgenia yuyongxinii]
MSGTTSAAVSTRLVEVREATGISALGRVLTLIIVATDNDVAERAIQSAKVASREHPCRIIVMVSEDGPGNTRLDAEIRVGGDAGASEVIVLHARGRARQASDAIVVPLLLPDAPVVAWWPGTPPRDPAGDPIGAIAQRRITDVSSAPDPLAALHRLGRAYSPGDTDLAWSRVTLWRGLLAAAVNEPPHEAITAATVTGTSSKPWVHLLAGWLAERLGVPVQLAAKAREVITTVELARPSGPIMLRRTPASSVAFLTRPGRPDQRINLPLRSVQDCLIEELRSLHPDQTYGRALTRGLPVLEER